MKTVTVSLNIDNYTDKFPHYDGVFNELEKFFWVAGQEIQSLKYLHALYVDSYAILDKHTYLVDVESSARGNITEAGHRLGLYNLIPSFAPGKPFQSIDELSFYWKLLFLSSITPDGLKNFIKFITANYIIHHDIDTAYLGANKDCPTLKRINNVLPKINTFIYEWSSTSEAQVGGYYFFPGSLPFMSIHVLVGLHTEILYHIDTAELAHHIYNQLQEYKDSKLTPTLYVETINITEAWQNG